MLIGINLNHPVNQHPLQQTNYGSQTFGDGMECTSTRAGAHNSQYHSQLGQSIDLYSELNSNNSSSRREINFLYDNEKLSDECKRMRKQVETPMQTFEYPPYQVIQFERSNLTNECQNYGTSNVGTCPNNYYQDQHCPNNIGKQVVTFTKQAEDCNHATYQLSAFNAEHQQNYQYQSIPYELSTHNNGYYV